MSERPSTRASIACRRARLAASWAKAALASGRMTPNSVCSLRTCSARPSLTASSSSMVSSLECSSVRFLLRSLKKSSSPSSPSATSFSASNSSSERARSSSTPMLPKMLSSSEPMFWSSSSRERSSESVANVVAALPERAKYCDFDSGDCEAEEAALD
ncbi:hypothetical protein TYRP_013888 [Tyrophagus putrescentiae]|nr:hypothetical protein TYRP_013888 [Tyrophagus putrescentiae]